MKCHGNHSLFYKTRKETRKLQNITKLNTPCPMFYEQTGLLVTRKAQNGCKWSSSVQFICSVMSNSLGPHGLQHARLPCPSPTPRAYSNSCPSSRWCLPTISSSVTPSPLFNLSQHQSFFQWVSSSHQVAKVLEFQLQQVLTPRGG